MALYESICQVDELVRKKQDLEKMLSGFQQQTDQLPMDVSRTQQSGTRRISSPAGSSICPEPEIASYNQQLVETEETIRCLIREQRSLINSVPFDRRKAVATAVTESAVQSRTSPLRKDYAQSNQRTPFRDQELIRPSRCQQIEPRPRGDGRKCDLPMNVQGVDDPTSQNMSPPHERHITTTESWYREKLAQTTAELQQLRQEFQQFRQLCIDRTAVAERDVAVMPAEGGVQYQVRDQSVRGRRACGSSAIGREMCLKPQNIRASQDVYDHCVLRDDTTYLSKPGGVQPDRRGKQMLPEKSIVPISAGSSRHSVPRDPVETQWMSRTSRIEGVRSDSPVKNIRRPSDRGLTPTARRLQFNEPAEVIIGDEYLTTVQPTGSGSMQRRYILTSPTRRPEQRKPQPPDDDGDGDGDEDPDRNRKSKSSQSSVSSSFPDQEKNTLSQRPKCVIKPPKFDGSGSLPTFLRQFEICSKFYQWQEKDKLAHLLCSLEGAAGQLLWDSGAADALTYVQFVEKLEQRYGVGNQQEKFRSELQFRQRRKGETLATLHADVCRLMTLAFPNQPPSEMWDDIAKEHFINALADPSLQLRVREKEPTNLNAAYKAALRLESFAQFSQPAYQEGTSHREGRRSRDDQFERVRRVAESQHARNVPKFDYIRATTGDVELPVENYVAQPRPTPSTAERYRDDVPTEPPASGGNRYHGNRWNERRPGNTRQPANQRDNQTQGRIAGIFAGRGDGRPFIELGIEGRRRRCLLDSSSDYS